MISPLVLSFFNILFIFIYFGKSNTSLLFTKHQPESKICTSCLYDSIGGHPQSSIKFFDYIYIYMVLFTMHIIENHLYSDTANEHTTVPKSKIFYFSIVQVKNHEVTFMSTFTIFCPKLKTSF